MTRVEQLFRLCESQHEVAMSKRAWEQLFPGLWMAIKPTLLRLDEICMHVPRVDKITSRLEVIELPRRLVGCDPDTREIIEELTPDACESWKFDKHALERTFARLIGGASTSPIETEEGREFGTWPIRGPAKFRLFFSRTRTPKELTAIISQWLDSPRQKVAVITWTDRHWEADLASESRPKGVHMIPLHEVLDLGENGWRLSDTWPTFERILRSSLDAPIRRGKQADRVIGRTHERRDAIERIVKALRDIAYERLRQYESASPSERDALRSEKVYWKCVAKRAGLRLSRISKAQQSKAGETARQLFELVNDPYKLFSGDSRAIAMLSCDSVVELKSKSILTSGVNIARTGR